MSTFMKITCSFIYPSTDYATLEDVCKDKPLTRKVGLVTGTDNVCTLAGPEDFTHWSVSCSGILDI